MKNQTGSTSSALKAMASSIMGSGGILLAVSLVTTAFTYMAQNGLSVGDVIDKMTGNFDTARKAIQDMNAEVTKETANNIPPLPIIEPAKAFNAPPVEPVLFFKYPKASTVAVILLPIPIIP